MALTTTGSIAEAVGKIAEAVMWFIKYRLFTALPEARNKLTKECEAIENDISIYRKKISEAHSVEYANVCNAICDGLRRDLARKRRELEYLSSVSPARGGGDGDQDD